VSDHLVLNFRVLFNSPGSLNNFRGLQFINVPKVLQEPLQEFLLDISVLFPGLKCVNNLNEFSNYSAIFRGCFF